MNKETKVGALTKLEKIRIKIGYPDKWKDYSGLEVKDDSGGSTISYEAFDVSPDDKLYLPEEERAVIW